MLNTLEQKSGFSTWVRFTLDDPAVRAFCDPAGSASFSQLQENLKALCASTAKIVEEARGEAGVDPLLEWLTCFHDYATRLLDIFELPIGQERFASLQSWKLALQGVMTEFRKAYMEISKRAQSVRYTSDDSAAMAKILTVKFPGLSEHPPPHLESRRRCSPQLRYSQRQPYPSTRNR